MSYTFRYGDGARAGGTGTRTIANIAGSVLTPNVGDISGAAVGDIFEIFNNTGGNNGFYVLTAITVNAGADNYALRPPLINEAVGTGSVARLTRGNVHTLAASAITSVTALPGAGNLAVIEVNGCDFKTDEQVSSQDLKINDAVAVSGSGTAANNGLWYIQEILSEDKIVVRPPDGGAGMATQGAGGSIAARRGIHRVFITNEASVSWQDIYDTTTALPGPVSGSFASGSIRDFLRRKPLAPAADPRTHFDISGITFVTIDQSGLGAPSTWVSLNEVVVGTRGNVTGGGDASFLTINATGTWGAGNEIDFFLGDSAGDRYTASDGSVWVGVRLVSGVAGGLLAGVARFNAYGSYFDHLDAALAMDLSGAESTGVEVIGSIFRGGTRSFDGGLIESTVFYGSFAYVSSGESDSDNILIASQTESGSFSGTPITVGGWLLSDTIVPVIPTGGWSYITPFSLLVFLNERNDQNILDFMVESGTSHIMERHFTFNRIFSVRVAGVLVPIVGLAVRIVELNETTLAETVVFDGVTGAGGRINAGAGVNLRVESVSGPDTTMFNHTLILGGTVVIPFKLHGPERDEWTIPEGFSPAPSAVVGAEFPAIAVNLTGTVEVAVETAPVAVEVLE